MPVDESFASRIARLERSNRRLGAILLFVVLATGLFVACGSGMKAPGQGAAMANSTSSRFTTIEARAFVLTDATGKTRAILGEGDDGSVGLGILDKASKVRISLTLSADGTTSLDYIDEDSRYPVNLAAGPRGGAGLNLKGKEQIGLVAPPHSSATLLIQDVPATTILSRFP